MDKSASIFRNISYSFTMTL